MWRRVDARGITRELVAVNADAAASATDVQSQDQIGVSLKAAAQASSVTFLKPSAEGVAAPRDALPVNNRTPPIDLPLLIAGLVLLVLDALLSRWFSHATVGASGAFTNAVAAPRTAAQPTQRGAAA